MTNPNGRYQLDIIITDTLTNQIKWQYMNWRDYPLECSGELRTASMTLRDLVDDEVMSREWPESQEPTYDEVRNAELSMRPPAPDPALHINAPPVVLEAEVVAVGPLEPLVPTIGERNALGEEYDDSGTAPELTREEGGEVP